MKTFSINTLGCKVNQYESQQIRQFLQRLGLSQVSASEKPDLVVVNTCCVTHTASAKSRHYIRKALRSSRDTLVVAAGCLPRADPGELNIDNDNLYTVHRLEELPALLLRVTGRQTDLSEISQQHTHNNTIESQQNCKIKPKNNLVTEAALRPLTSFQGRTRAFLKVQDGCDGCCSYCIIPRTRPIVHSKPLGQVLAEAQTLVSAGHKEIVLTGVFLGAYGQSTVRRKRWQRHSEYRLAELLGRIAQIQGLARIRLSSLEPGDVTERLVKTMAGHPNIMPHLHLSLQSGSEVILRKMGRQYSKGQFQEKVAMIKTVLDRPAITTDIIVGFPGERQADFEQTVELAREAGFAKMHVFAFSPRKGTAAARMQDLVATEVIKRRSELLRQLDSDLGRRFRKGFIGSPAEVLTEQGKGRVVGRSERYFKVYVDGAKPGGNDLVRVRLVANELDGVRGEVISQGIGVR